MSQGGRTHIAGNRTKYKGKRTMVAGWGTHIEGWRTTLQGNRTMVAGKGTHIPGNRARYQGRELWLWIGELTLTSLFLKVLFNLH